MSSQNADISTSPGEHHVDIGKISSHLRSRRTAQRLTVNSLGFFFHRVPEELRNRKKSAYTPRLVSIGPLHADDKHLKSSPMQDIKKDYVNSLLDRMGGSNPEKLLHECVDKMKDLKSRAKALYPEPDGQLFDEQMMFVDGCFILELLYRYYHGSFSEGVDPILGNSWTRDIVQHDLLLYENQIPFFVLDKLFLLITTISNHYTSYSAPTLTEHIRFYFDNLMNPPDHDQGNGTRNKATITNGYLTNKQISTRYPEYFSVLHVVHDGLTPNPQFHEKGPKAAIDCATDLGNAGIKFAVSSKHGNPFQVKFEPHFNRATFEIPKLTIDDFTETLLRNLMAFELLTNNIPYFTSYAYLMDMILNEPKDVQVLEKAGVINNNLGDDLHVSNIFNRLTSEIVMRDYFFFSQTCEEVAKYTKRWWPKHAASFKRTYFESPWTLTAFFLAFITTGVTILNFTFRFVKY